MGVLRNGTIENDHFMGSIDIQTSAVKRESNRVVIQSCVCARVVLFEFVSAWSNNGGRRKTDSFNWGLGQTCNQLLDVPDTLNLGKGRAKCRLIPEVEINSAKTVGSGIRTGQAED
jgi:hypothetical protein